MRKGLFDPERIIIRLYEVSKHFGETDALVNVTFDVCRNAFFFISGPSGAGKSTLMKLLYLGEHMSSGYAIVDGMNLTRIQRNQVPLLRRRLGIIFQDYRLIPNKSVFDNVGLVLEVSGIRSRKVIRERVMAVLEKVGMAGHCDACPPTLSGGEQQRVAVARAMVGNPSIILADEPTASLDPEAAEMIFDLLVSAHSEGATIVITTHDRYLLSKGCTGIVYLKDGRCVFPDGAGR
ncbi:MAG: ATP-binding cassette domain-containing protein [Desulfosalsimonadaceae bacterium]